MKQTFEIPDGCNRVTIEQQGRQIITTFEPDFKDGDIIYCKDLAYEYVFIFKSLSDNKNNPFWCYVSFGLADESDDNVNYNVKVRGSEDIIRIATESEKQQLFDALAKEGKQWNPEKKCIEDLKPEFNDGDIIYVTCSKIFIIKDFEKGSFHAFLDTNYDNIVLNDFLSPRFGGFKCRIASLDEINKIKQSLYKVGKIWNAEKKCIENIKWRAKQGNIYWLVNTRLESDSDTEQFSRTDNGRYNAGNYFQTEQQAKDAAEKMKELLKQINQ